MGTYYWATLAVGIEVDPKSFFFEEKRTQVVVCSHPEAKGNKYCPTCGTERSMRVHEEVAIVPKAQFKGLVPYDEEEANDPDSTYEDYRWEWLYDTSTLIGELNLINIGGGYGEDIYIYGTALGKVGGWNGPSRLSHPGDVVQNTVNFVQVELKKLGIVTTPLVHLMMTAG